MRSINTEIDIYSPADHVWAILINFHNYNLWNPFIEDIKGTLEVGNKLKVRFKNNITFKPTVTKLVPQKELSWVGKLFFKGLFDCEHIFILEKVNDKKTRFIQKENFSGLLVPLFSGVIKKAEKGFSDMNKILKSVSEI
ncbi:MAG: SRPBCC domain-containing protein [Nanoarchaeota archaeon]|nr:SRPBCC domain-containing protein [Nanoarchaeota archaeon]